MNANRRFDEFQIFHLGKKQSDWAVGNRERWQSFRRIGPYLGFVETRRFGVRTEDSRVRLDCRLQRCFSEGTERASRGPNGISDFAGKCADALPFLDGGSASVPCDSSSGEFSGGLSISLLHLEVRGLVKLETKSDADSAVIVVGGEVGDRRPVSYAQWLGAKKNSRGRKS